MANLLPSAELLPSDTLLPGEEAEPEAPAVTTGEATGVRTTSVVLHATANPHGRETSGRFEYGTTSAYGHTTGWQALGAGTAAVAFTATLTGLEPGVTYHYRANAESTAGIVSGTDATFTTTAKESATPLAIRLRERPRLDLSWDVQTPNGAHYRWGWDDPDPLNVPENSTLSDAMPGGFERAACTLQRDPRINYPDLQELAKVTIRGLGGAQIAWQGQLEKLPDTSGSQAQVSPEGVGYQALLEADKSAREIYVDQELSRWEGETLAQRILSIEAGFPTNQTPQVAASGASLLPALVTAVESATAKTDCMAFYDAHGIPIGKLGYVCETDFPATGMTAEVLLADDDVFTGYKSIAASSGVPDVMAGGEAYKWACVRIFNSTAAAGENTKEQLIYWFALPVYGMHGLMLYPSSDGVPSREPPLTGKITKVEVSGVLGSDVVAHAIGKWASGLTLSYGGEGTIEPTSFVIPQLAFLEPTTVAEILKQATRFDLPDYAVWEGPTFWMNARGKRGREWRARTGPSKLEDAGPQASRMWNGVVVAYASVDGKERLVGPPGFAGAESSSAESSGLEDADPENPLNKLGRRQWATLKMGTSTQAGAIRVGEIFLAEQAQVETSGQATLTGHVEDTTGALWPAWMVRSGDTIQFTDSRYTQPRRVVKKEYADTSKAASISLDAPPEVMQAVLERLGVVLVGTGVS